MKCPNCGGDNEENAKYCQYCNSEITFQMRRDQQGIKRCPQCGGSHIQFNRENTGTVRNNTFTQVINKTVGFCSDCGYTWYPNGDNEPPRINESKKPNNENYMILWILGWICFFPIPIMVLIWRKKNTWKVATKILVTVLFWGFFLGYGAFASYQDESSTRSKVEKVSTEHKDGTLYDIPEDLTKKYEKAKYDKFNSYAEENGLDGTWIWIEGKMGDVLSLKVSENKVECTVLQAFIEQDDGRKWLVALDVDELCDAEDYQDMKGHRVCVCGSYCGFSDVYEMPGLFLHRIFDENSGLIVTSKAYNKK